MKRTTLSLFFVFFVVSLWSQSENRAVWQWSVEIPTVVHSETNAPSRAFLWIPERCKSIRGVVMGCHNMSEEGILEHEEFRRTLAELGLAEVWITPGLDQPWDVTKGTQQAFEQMMRDLAFESGYDELATAPIVPIGHSAMATMPWNFAAWNPERTLAILSIHGDTPRTKLTGYGRANMEWGDRSVEGIPSLFVMAEYEWWEARLTSGLEYRRTKPNAPLSLLADAGHGHFDHSDALVNYLGLFLKKTMQKRWTPNGLRPVRAESGWLAERWVQDKKPRFSAASYAQYKGDRANAFWYFDREMVEATERFYALQRGKETPYIGVCRQGKQLPFNPQAHAKIITDFQPQIDGLTFSLKGCFTDSTRREIHSVPDARKIKLSRICGPITQLDDTTFSVRFYRMGLNNSKRTGGVWILASYDGDSRYKSAVQELTFQIPLRNTLGQPQTIVFPAVSNPQKRESFVRLQAKATSDLPVKYYVREGPAYIDGNRLVFTPVPPRAKRPVRVTVVAWQYGIKGKWQTADAIEQTVLVNNK